MVKAKKIFCVVAYDIQDDRSRIQISKILEKYGTRINYSVFECMFTDRQFQKIQINLAYIIHSGFISGYQNRYGDNLKPPTNVYHRMTA